MKNKIDIFIVSLPLSIFASSFISFSLTPNELSFTPLNQFILASIVFISSVFAIALFNSTTRLFKYKTNWPVYVLLIGFFSYTLSTFLLLNHGPESSGLLFLKNLILSLLIAFIISGIITHLWPKKSTA